MLAKRCGHVSEHRIGVAGDPHQVRRMRPFDDAGRERVELARRDAHMKCRAHIQTHGQSMELGHEAVFETGTLELRACREHFRANESCDVVDNRPHAGLLLDVPGHAVSARLERHHVHAVGSTVGHFRTLTGLEIQSRKVASEIEDAVDIHPDHAGDRC